MMTGRKLKRGKKIDVEINAGTILEMFIEDTKSEIKKCVNNGDEKNSDRFNCLLNFATLNENYFIDRINKIIKIHNKDRDLFVDSEAVIYTVFIVFKSEILSVFSGYLFDTLFSNP